jgi:thymidylate kinase
MIIILEGPDGAGKTMLAQQLSKQTKYPIEHRTKPKDEAEKQLMMGKYLQDINSGKNVIFDRCWYSEMAYGPVMRDKSVISFPQMYELEKRLAKAGAIIIYCTGPAHVLWKRCQKRGEDYITSKDAFNAIYKNFEELFAAPHYIPVVRYEYTEV